VHQYAQDEPQSDDITVMALRYDAFLPDKS
jgi:hypothetical protein